MSKQLQFSDYTKSRLFDLYGDDSTINGGDSSSTKIDDNVLYKNVESHRAHLKLVQNDGGGTTKPISLHSLQRRIIDQEPCIASVILDETLTPHLDRFTAQSVEKMCQILDAVPLGEPSCTINLTKLRHFDQVKAYEAGINNNMFFPPRFRIKVGRVPANSSVRINTGYIMTMPTVCQQRKLVNGKIERGNKCSVQPEFVVVPYFHLSEKQKGDIIPCVYAKDPEDTGLLTFSFTTRSGDVGNVLVALRAFATASRVSDNFFITKSEADSNSGGGGDGGGPVQTIAKPKDFKNGRLTANLKLKFDATSMDVEKMTIPNDDKQQQIITKALFKTYNTTAACPTTHHEHQRLVFMAKNTVLFSSRKREWCNRHMVTFAGVLTPNTHLVPFVAHSDAPQSSTGVNNTHCCTLIESRRSLYSVMLENTDPNRPIGSMKIVNGAFANIEHYECVKKSLRQLVKGLSGLFTGVKQCERIARNDTRIKDSNTATANNLMKLYDYHHSVSATNEKFYELLTKSDKEMFDTQLTVSKPYSVSVYQAFAYLTYIYFRNELNESNSTLLSSFKPKTKDPSGGGGSDGKNIKPSRDDDDNTADKDLQHQHKRQKTE